MATQSDKVTVYIGRFNPFHNGHAHVLKRALETSKLVILLLGSAGLARSLKNPFTFDERKEIIQRWYSDQKLNGQIKMDRTGNFDVPECELVIAPLRDFPYNDSHWIRNVQAMVNGAVDMRRLRNPQIHITGSDRDSSTWYLNAFPQWKLDLVSPHRPNGTGELSATRVRELLLDDVPAEEAAEMVQMMPSTTYEYLCEFMGSPEHTRLKEWYRQNKAYKLAWSKAPYAPIFTTVDAVVVQSGHILVVERGAEPGKGLWALPGGFLNQDERLRDGAVRELLEETGILLAEGKKAKEITREILKGSIRETHYFDAPDRSMRGRTLTHAFLFKLDDTKPLPKVKGQFMPLHESGGKKIVETANAFWLPIDEALTRMDMWFEDHHAIIETMIGSKDL